MKHLYLLIITLFCAISAIAQPWLGTVPGNIYYNQGNVGIGTMTPAFGLDIGSNSFGLTGSILGGNNRSAATAVVTNTALSLASNFANPGIVACIQSNFTGTSDTPGAIMGIVSRATTDPTSTGNLTSKGAGGGLRNRYVVAHAGAGIVSQMSAITAITNIFSTVGGLVTSASSFHSESPIITSGSTMTNFYGLWVRGGSVAGALTNRYGVYIDDMVGGTNRYGIYQAGVTEKNYFAGNVGIGTTNPEAKLTVKGKIVASEIQVKDFSAIIPDYVFKADYELMPLSHVEEFVKQNQHLPEVPSEKEFKENGMNVAEMNALLLKKVEELTLYVIEQSKQTIEQNKQINLLKEENKAIRNLIAK